MDGLKLLKWRENFISEVQNLQVEYDAMFLNKELSQCYELKNEDFELKQDEGNQTFTLRILNPQLPKQVEDRLQEIFIQTKPEDSI